MVGLGDSGASTLMALAPPTAACASSSVAAGWDAPISTSRAVLVSFSFSGSMLEARRFSGDEERWGTSASPFIIARLEMRKGDWLLAELGTGPVSSPPLSLSRVRSA